MIGEPKYKPHQDDCDRKKRERMHQEKTKPSRTLFQRPIPFQSSSRNVLDVLANIRGGRSTTKSFKAPVCIRYGERGIRRAVMIRTAFALLALATLAKNDASGRFRLADACTAIVRAFTDNVSESHSQRFAPMASVCPSRKALAMSGIGPHLFRDVLRASES
jgi:hypothetical protein